MKRLTFLLLFALYSEIIISQSDTTQFHIKKESMHLPHSGDAAGHFKHSISLAMLYLPTAWLEQATSVPMIDYKANLSLGKGFQINTHIKTLAIANDWRLGVSWNYSVFKHWHLGLGYQAGYDFGILKDYGYNNTLKAIQQHPMVHIGFDTHNMAFTIKGKMDFISRVSLSAADFTGTIKPKTINGYSLGLYIEQRLFKSKSFCIGLISNFNQFHILGWPALHVVRKKYFIPEINLGYKF